jgi:hypothetical protein
MRSWHLLGRAVAERFRRSGAHVWVWDLAPVAQSGIDSLMVDVTRLDQCCSWAHRD